MDKSFNRCDFEKIRQPLTIPESCFTVSTTFLGPTLLKERERSRAVDWVCVRKVDWVRERARASS